MPGWEGLKSLYHIHGLSCRSGKMIASRAKSFGSNSWSQHKIYIYLSSPYAVCWRGVDFKLCLRIDVWVAAAQVLVAVCSYKSLTSRYTHTLDHVEFWGWLMVQGAGDK
jgi:hypothetical protein